MVRGGRIYPQRVLDLMHPLKQPHHKVILTSKFKLDIEWWQNYIDHFNCTFILRPSGPQVDVCTDSCGSGAGMVTYNDWSYVNWQSDMPEILETHINVKETVAVVAAVIRWASLWTGTHVRVHTDNITTKAAINKGRCTSSLIMCFVRHLFWLSEQFQFTITRYTCQAPLTYRLMLCHVSIIVDIYFISCQFWQIIILIVHLTLAAGFYITVLLKQL